MSVTRPADPPLPRRGRRWGLVIAVGVVLAVIAWIAFSGIGNALVYYLTPTELTARNLPNQAVRLGGLVKQGTLSCENGEVSFTVTDGTREIRVISSPDVSVMCPREGVGVVVEGTLSVEGVFVPTQVIVKHDENYVAPSAGEIPSHIADPGT